MLKQESAAAAVCGNCGTEEKRLLHHVRHRGIFRRLCTSCVLRLHPQSFCPTCFLVYDHSPPPPNDAVSCFKCYSSSHSLCLGSTASNPYVCPLCANPNAPIFSLMKSKDGEGEKNESCSAIDKKAARVLFAAARIAAVSMSKAAVAARAEAERRAKEAAFTKKRAREALEHVACLVAKEKLKRKELLTSGSGNVGVQENKNHRGGTANGGVVAAVAELNRIGDKRVDDSSEVLAALNAVELSEKDKLQDLKSHNVAMDAEGVGAASVNSVQKLSSGHLDNQKSEQGEKVSNGLLSVSPVDQPQYVQNNHAREEKIGSQQ